MPYRLLLITHHITSRAKIQRLTRAADQQHVSVLIKKTHKPPGIMICESDTEKAAREWLSVVKSLRYKGYRFVTGEQLSGPRILNNGKDGLRVVDGTDEFNNELDDLSMRQSEPSIKTWWKTAMGFQSS